MTFVSAAVFLAAIFWFGRAGRLTQPSVLAILYFLGSAFVYFWIIDFDVRRGDLFDMGLQRGRISFTAMPLADGKHEIWLSFYHLCVMLLVLAALYATTRRANRDALRRIKSGYATANQWLVPSIIMTTIFLIFCYAYVFIQIDKSVLVLNYDYLSIKTPSTMGLDDDPVARVILLALPYFGAVSTLLLLLSISTRNRALVALTFISFCYPTILMMLGNSRWPALYFFFLLMGGVLQSHRFSVWHTVRSISLLFLGLFTFSLVIIGRNRSVFGLSSYTGDFLLEVIEFIPITIAGMTLNLLDGLLNFSNAAGIAPAYYDTAYKILSFSPLPSIVDGFDAYLLSSQARISDFVPFNAFSESFWFGPIFYAVIIILYAGIIKLLDKVYFSENAILRVASSIVSLLCTVSFNEYPIRNVLRVSFTLVGVLLLASRLLGSRRRQERNQIGQAPRLK